MDGERALRECSSQRCPGESPEIFEKSIDKHEIDAILNRRPVETVPYGAVDGRAKSEDSAGRIRPNHPDTRIPIEIRRELSCA